MNEKIHILNAFEKNFYNRYQGITDFLKASQGPVTKKELVEVAFSVQLPFIQRTMETLAYIRRSHQVSSTFRPLKTIFGSLRSIKDPVDPKNMKGVYLIPCSSGTPYIELTGHSIYQRIQEHTYDLRHCRNHSSPLAKHAEMKKHHICLQDSQLLGRIDYFHHHKLRKAIEIENKSNMLNRELGWKMSNWWITSLYFSASSFLFFSCSWFPFLVLFVSLFGCFLFYHYYVDCRYFYAFIFNIY